VVSVKKLGLVAVVLVALVVLGYFLLANAGYKATLLNAKPTLTGEFIKNPDIIHSSLGWLSATPYNLLYSKTVLNVSTSWVGDGWVGFSLKPLGGRSGIAIISPINISAGKYMGRHIEQSTSLPKGSNYLLNIGIADGADMLQPYGYGNISGSCADVGIKVIINDMTKNKAYTVFNKIVRNGRWYDYSIDLGSNFSGNDIAVRAESYAADGGCGLWNGEWAVVDYVDIARV